MDDGETVVIGVTLVVAASLISTLDKVLVSSTKPATLDDGFELVDATVINTGRKVDGSRPTVVVLTVVVPTEMIFKKKHNYETFL